MVPLTDAHLLGEIIKLLRQFVIEAGFVVLGDTTQHTFHHHSLQSTSRLDYILQLKDQPYIIKKYSYPGPGDTNLCVHYLCRGGVKSGGGRGAKSFTPSQGGGGVMKV